MKPIQYFSKEYLERCRLMKPDQIVGFLEDFRRLHQEHAPRASRLISIKVPETLLNAFKTRSRLGGIPYQTQIKRLMAQWLEQGHISDQSQKRRPAKHHISVDQAAGFLFYNCAQDAH